MIYQSGCSGTNIDYIDYATVTELYYGPPGHTFFFFLLNLVCHSVDNMPFIRG